MIAEIKMTIDHQDLKKKKTYLGNHIDVKISSGYNNK